MRDGVNTVALTGAWGEALNDPATGYSVVYHMEIGLLFVTLVALGPLVTRARKQTLTKQNTANLGLADFPT